MAIDSERSAKFFGVFQAFDSIADTVIIHEPIEHMNRHRDIYQEQLYPELQKMKYSENRDVIQAGLERMKWFMARDPKHISAVAKEISDKKCIVFTDYMDKAYFIAKQVVNGAIIVDSEEKLEEWKKSDKPGIFKSGSIYLENIDQSQYIVYFTDVDWHGSQLFAGKEVHFFNFRNSLQNMAVRIISSGKTIDNLFDDELNELIDLMSEKR